MKSNHDKIKRILNEPSYWIESINGYLYDSIVRYMESNDMNRTELAKHLGISKGRVSQILNDGEINFSIEKLIEISLKVDKYPLFELKDIGSYINEISNYRDVVNFDNNYFVIERNKKEITSFKKEKTFSIAV